MGLPGASLAVVFGALSARHPSSVKHATSMGKKPDPVDMLVGRNIKLHRLAKSMSQEELAHKLGLTFQQLQKYERGINRVGGGRLFRISTILGIEISAFFEGAERPDRALPVDTFSPLSLIADPQ